MRIPFRCGIRRVGGIDLRKRTGCRRVDAWNRPTRVVRMSEPGPEVPPGGVAPRIDPSELKLLLVQSRAALRIYIARKIPPELVRVLDADDIVQEAHVAAFRRIDSFRSDGPEAFGRWLAAIAVNCLRNGLQRARALKRGGGAAFARAPMNRDDSTFALLKLIAGSDQTASRTAARTEALSQLESALGGLPAHYREAIALVHIEGHSCAEAAVRMNRTERAVHGLCRRALRLLAVRMEEAGMIFSPLN